MKTPKILGFLLLIFIYMIISVPFQSCESDDKDEDDICNINIETVNIPAGTISMKGSGQMTLSAFKMSKYEITNAQYAAFLNTKRIGSNGKYKAGAYPKEALIYTSIDHSDWGLQYTDGQWVPETGYENHPVIFVTWYGATEFATYVGGRLPTEAEWEYACRAGTTTPFNTGDCLSNEQANYLWAYPYGTCTNTNTASLGTTQAVGSYAPNAYGLYDMHGNVHEWCNDWWYNAFPAYAQTNPTGPLSGSCRVYRGGSWERRAAECQSSERYRNTPNFNGDHGPGRGRGILGFRPVLPQ